MDACPLCGVVLINAFQSIFHRPVADVFVIGGIDLLLGHQKCPVFVRQERWRIREIQDVACLETPIFGTTGLSAKSLRAECNPCHLRSLRDRSVVAAELKMLDVRSWSHSQSRATRGKLSARGYSRTAINAEADYPLTRRASEGLS